MWKIAAILVSMMAILGTFLEASGLSAPSPVVKAKGKAQGGDADLRKAYGLLRRLRTDDKPVGRPGERLRDWTDRAVAIYRLGVRARRDGDTRLAHEYGAAAHDLAQAVNHSRNAERLEEADPDLPPPVEGMDADERDEIDIQKQLTHADARIREIGDLAGDPEARFYLVAAGDLSKAARRDLADGRLERAAELTQAAEAMSHVPEHLGHALAPKPEPTPKAKRQPSPDTKKKGEKKKSATNDPPPAADKKTERPRF